MNLDLVALEDLRKRIANWPLNEDVSEEAQEALETLIEALPALLAIARAAERVVVELDTFTLTSDAEVALRAALDGTKGVDENDR